MTSAASLAQAAQTLTRDPWTLPESWWDADVTLAIAAWVKREKDMQR